MAKVIRLKCDVGDVSPSSMVDELTKDMPVFVCSDDAQVQVGFFKNGKISEDVKTFTRAELYLKELSEDGTPPTEDIENYVIKVVESIDSSLTLADWAFGKCHLAFNLDSVDTNISSGAKWVAIVLYYGAAKKSTYIAGKVLFVPSGTENQELTEPEIQNLKNEILNIVDGVEADVAAVSAAKTAAETAQGKAEAAQGKAETAQGKAEVAQAQAEAAATAVGVIKDAVDAAKAAAETAQGKAEAAQGKAETAQGKAEAAESGAKGYAQDSQEAWAQVQATAENLENTKDVVNAAKIVVLQAAAEIEALDIEGVKEAAETAIEKAGESEENAELARKWASEDEDVVVVDDEYSAKHYAAKSAAKAQDAATSAQDAANADNSAQMAKADAVLASSSANADAQDAAAAKTLAQKWASESEDVVVAGGEYSAKHYAAKAGASKTAAQTAQGAAEAAQGLAEGARDTTIATKDAALSDIGEALADAKDKIDTWSDQSARFAADEAKIEALELGKVNSGALYLSGGSINAPSASRPPYNAYSYAFTLSVAYSEFLTWSTYSAKFGNNTNSFGFKVLRIPDGAAGARMYFSLATGVDIVFAGEAAIKQFFDGKPKRFVVCGDDTQLKLYINNSTIVSHAVSFSSDFQSGLFFTGLRGSVARVKVFNFDMSAAGAPYTVADYTAGIDEPPALHDTTAAQKALLSLADYTVKSGTTQTILDASGNANDAVVSGSVAGTNDTAIGRLIDFIKA